MTPFVELSASVLKDRISAGIFQLHGFYQPGNADHGGYLCLGDGDGPLRRVAADFVMFPYGELVSRCARKFNGAPRVDHSFIIGRNAIYNIVDCLIRSLQRLGVSNDHYLSFPVEESLRVSSRAEMLDIAI